MHPSSFSRSAHLGALLVLTLSGAGCLKKQGVEQHFYENHIQPIFNSFCVGNTSPCHKVNPDTGVALGNLDLSSFDNVQKRRDVLRTYGSYPKPLLLLKAIPEDMVPYSFLGKPYSSEIRHTGGKPLLPSSDAAFELQNWLENGANRDGILPAGKPNTGIGGCNSTIPAGFTDPGVDKNSPAYTTFQSDIFPLIKDSCAFSTCHSSPQSDFYVTCGDDENQQLFNFVQTASFVVGAGTDVVQSEILLRPLAVPGGGINHTGGVFFKDRMDATWKQWHDWAATVQASPLPAAQKSMGRQFFEANVLPKFVQRGCALEGCHSPDGFNDFRLRPGAQGFLSPGAIQRDYETTLFEFAWPSTASTCGSRASSRRRRWAASPTVAGALLEEEGVTAGTACAQPFPANYDPTLKYDPNNPATAPAVCVFQEWHRIERTERASLVSTMAAGETLPLAFISRPASPDSLLEFDHYQGGADLKIAQATMGPGGQVMSVGAATTALGPCVGLAGKDVDVRGPEWSYDGTKLIFAARPGAATGFDLWQLDFSAPTAPTCQQLTMDNGKKVNQVTVHNFDPVYAPDGSVVFASVRAGTVTLKNFYPNADLFRVLAPAMNFANPQQMTFLLNSEISPAFMQDGRVTMTTEKATPEFYQLAGRRMNWDLTDYHPLLAQRAQSTTTFDTMEYPSIGYQQATEIREGLDRNFLIILSNAGAKGAGGALATFNRSVNSFEADRPQLIKVTFVKSVVIIDPAGDGPRGHEGRLPLSLLAAERRDPGVVRRRRDRSVADAAVRPRRRRRHGQPARARERRGGVARRGDPRLQALGAPPLRQPAAARLRRAQRRDVRHSDDALPRPAAARDAAGREPAQGPQRRRVRRRKRAARLRRVAAARGHDPRQPAHLGPAGLADGVHEPHGDRVGGPRRGPLAQGGRARGQAHHPRARRLERHAALHDERGAPGHGRRVHHAGRAAGALQQHLRRLPRQHHGCGADVSVTADTLTGASVSLSRDLVPSNFQ